MTAEPQASPNRAPQRAEQRQPVRRRAGGGPGEWFNVDKRKIPAGMSYEFKRMTYGGKEDHDHQIDLTENGGWSPVPASRHPEMTGGRTEGHIIKHGQILMERPVELTREAETEDKIMALEQPRMQMTRLGMTPQGELPRKVTTAKRSYERVDVPGDDE